MSCNGIFKYRLESEYRQDIYLPEGSKILNPDIENGMVFLYIMGDKFKDNKSRFNILLVSGEIYRDDIEEYSYIGSVKTDVIENKIGNFLVHILAKHAPD